MTNFLDLQTRVSALIIDTPPTVTAAVPRLVNAAVKSAQKNYNFKVMEGVTTFTTTEGSLTLGNITGFKEYRDKGPFLFQQYERARRFLTAPASDIELATLMNSDYPDEPEFIVDATALATGVTSFTVAPYPNALSDWDDGNWRIVVPYYAYSTTLSADGDENWFTNNMDEFIEFRAAAEGFGLDHDYEAMALWLQRAKEKFDEAVREDKKRRLSSVDTLVPHWRGVLEPQVRR